MDFGIIGLGKMGSGLALQAMEKGFSVAGYTRSGADEELLSNGLLEYKNLTDLVRNIKRPRKIFLYIPAGPIVQDCVYELSQLLDSHDIILDGGNSYWGDSRLRFEEMLKLGIHFIDLGTSGGISGARYGASFMAGGNREAYEEVAPILQKLAVPDGSAYVGPSGSGHLVKLIHNGIEFGMLQAIGEGISLLEKFREEIPLEMSAVFSAYQHGSVIRSWLIDLMAEQFKIHGGVKNISSHVDDTGEVNWLLNDAIHLEVPVPVIAQSIMELFRSRNNENVDYRSIALMRHGFGGHAFGPQKELEQERISSRICQDFPEIRHEH